jgi:hypothetical protein
MEASVSKDGNLTSLLVKPSDRTHANELFMHAIDLSRFCNFQLQHSGSVTNLINQLSGAYYEPSGTFTVGDDVLTAATSIADAVAQILRLYFSSTNIVQLADFQKNGENS